MTAADDASAQGGTPEPPNCAKCGGVGWYHPAFAPVAWVNCDRCNPTFQPARKKVLDG